MRLRTIGAVAAATAALLGSAATAQAAITVANTNDSGAGSLRQAIAEAPPGETIVVPAGTYTLTSEELLILKPLTFVGAGAGETVVRGGGNFRLFLIVGATDVSIGGMTIRDGTLTGTSPQGVGLLATNTNLTLSGVVVTNNLANADGAPGVKGGNASAAGVLVANGELRLIDSRVIGNRASAVGGAGAEGGRAEATGVLVVGPVQVVNSTISDNVSNAAGGQGTANPAQKGGRAESAGLLGVQNAPRPTAILNSTISGNVAEAPGGPGANGGKASAAGMLEVSNAAPVLIADTTIAANTAGAAGAGGKAEAGGALLVAGSPGHISFVGSTIAANGVHAPSAEAGNLLAVKEVSFADTIVAGGVGPAGTENCLAVETASLGFNIDSADQCGFHSPGDRVNTDPLLGPLAFNGGPTQTIAPALGSPAIDQGAAFGLTTDQRGIVRPIDLPSIPNPAVPGADGSDIGAYERQPSNELALGGLKRNKRKGTALLTVYLPTPSAGSITLTGRGLQPQSLSIAGETVVALKVAIRNKKLRRALRRKGRRKVGITVTYAPTGNAPAAVSRKAKLLQRKRKRKHRKRHRTHRRSSNQAG